ncbi:toxin-antitoxin system TumE family protein [Methylophilus luteus]|uniref:DUF6516 family protein n=1 Tax=Methylophilus luteus TaxID=640108 RepID=A0ABW3F9B0_9PROT
MLVVYTDNMRAELLLKQKLILSESSFVEMVIWQLPEPLAGSVHAFKFRFAYVVDSECVLRFDNEVGKGNHYHRGQQEFHYDFVSTDQLIDDFFAMVNEMESSR